jgi:hypothetical protein
LAAWRCQVALGWFGHDNARQPDEVRVTEAIQLDEASHAKLLRPDALSRSVATLYDEFWRILSEVSIEHMPAGVPRLSRRSFSGWQDDFNKARLTLGAGEIELWNGGRSLARFMPTYLPHAAMAVPLASLEGSLGTLDLFRVGSAVEGLRDGGVLLDRFAPKWFANLFHEATLQIQGQREHKRTLDDASRRFLMRVGKAPRSKRVVLEQHGIEPGRLMEEFTILRDAHAHKMDRAGLVSCGDLGTAMTETLGGAKDGSMVSHKRIAEYSISKRAQSLLLFYLSADFGQLRVDADVSDRI